MSDHLHRKETKVSFDDGDSNMLKRALLEAKTNIYQSPNCVLKDHMHVSLKVPNIEFDFIVWVLTVMHRYTRT